MTRRRLGHCFPRVDRKSAEYSTRTGTFSAAAACTPVKPAIDLTAEGTGDEASLAPSVRIRG